jgi:hypothetical protein
MARSNSYINGFKRACMAKAVKRRRILRIFCRDLKSLKMMSRDSRSREDISFLGTEGGRYGGPAVKREIP